MNVIPTLSSKGWAVTPEERIDAILAYYQALNPSMTNRYRGKVFSLQSAIWRGGMNMDTVANNVQVDLTTILTNNFPEGAEVTTTAVPIDEDGATYNLNIAATVVSDGRSYDMATSLDKVDSRFMTEYNVERT